MPPKASWQNCSDTLTPGPGQYVHTVLDGLLGHTAKACDSEPDYCSKVHARQFLVLKCIWRSALSPALECAPTVRHELCGEPSGTSRATVLLL